MVLALCTWFISGSLNMGNISLGYGDRFLDRFVTVISLPLMLWGIWSFFNSDEKSLQRKYSILILINCFLLIKVPNSQLVVATVATISIIIGLIFLFIFYVVSINRDYAGYNDDSVIVICNILAVVLIIEFIYTFLFNNRILLVVSLLGVIATLSVIFNTWSSYFSYGKETVEQLLTKITTTSVLPPILVVLIIFNWLDNDDFMSKDIDLLLMGLLVGILPFTNAFADWLSLSFTRGLLLKLQHSRHHWFKAWCFVIFDLWLAVCFILVVTATTLGVLGGFNSYAQNEAGRTLLDFSQLMKDVTIPEKLGETLWLHVMLFSTILPTLVHFGFALYGLLLGYGRKGVKERFDNLAYASEHERRWAYYYTTWIRWMALGILFLIIAAFFWLLNYWHEPLWLLWSWADTVLNMVDSTYVTPTF